MTEIKHYTNLEIENRDDSEIEIRAEIPEKILEKYKDRALKNLGKDISIDGFRKGNIPEKVLVDRVGEHTILHEEVQLAIADIYPSIVIDKNLQVIGRPEVTITKIAPKNPVEFKISTAVMPEVTLPDYKKIATSIHLDEKSKSVSDKEVTDALEQIKNGIIAQKKSTAEKNTPPSTSTNTPEEARSSANEDTEVELTDEFVKTLGDFKDLADFTAKIKENIGKEKEMKAKEKRRAEIMEKIIEESTIVVPKILVESELDKMLAQFKDDVLRMKVPFEDYLTKIKKTEADLKTEWKTDAEKRAKMQLILNKISVNENITPEKEVVEKEVNHVLEHYKDAKPENVRVYIETVLTNEKIFQLLENQK